MSDDFAKALLTTYRKTIWRPFMSAIKEYRLAEDGDAICVCVSGGKDSFLLAKCVQELARRGPMRVTARYLCMDPGFSPDVLDGIRANAELLQIPLEFFDTDIFDALDAMESGCAMCAKMRRGYLYRQAQKMGCSKIALGHHFDDAAETLLMSMLFSGQIRGMRPMVQSENVDGMALIRPLYKVREDAICAWRDDNGLIFPTCACRIARRADGTADSARAEAKALIRELTARYPDADKNIFRSAHNVMLDSLIGWKQNGDAHSFLDE